MLLKYKILGLSLFIMILIFIGSSYCIETLNETNSSDDVDFNETNEFIDTLSNYTSFNFGDGENAYALGDGKIYVDPNVGNDTSGSGNETNPYKSIKKAVNASVEYDIIILNDGTYSGADNKNITIDHSLSIFGRSYSGGFQDFTTSAILDGENNGQFLKTVSGATLNIRNITFQNANSSTTSSLGGAIFANGSIFSLYCVFKSNHASDESGGGAMHINGSFARVEDCIFDGNTGPRGGIYNDGVFFTQIKDSLFKNNIATDHGGAIDSVYGNHTDIENCNFINNKEQAPTNSGTMGGGAINCHEYGYNEMRIKNCNFSDNSATKNGGGICAENALDIEDCVFSNNIAGKNGSAIYIFPHNDTIMNAENNIARCYFINNNDSAGTIYAIFNQRNLLLTNSIFSDNNASAVYINGNNSTLRNLILDRNLNGVKINGDNNSLSNLSVLNNKNNGVTFDGDKNSINSSQILENTYSGFIINSGINNMVNYNRIYKNGLGGNISATASNSNATHNWWGFNNITNQYNNQSPVDISDWYVIELSAPEIDTTINASKTYDHFFPNAFLKYHFKLNNNTIYDEPSFLPYFEVNMTFKNETDNEILRNVPNVDIRNPLIYEVPISFGYSSNNNQNFFGNDINHNLLNIMKSFAGLSTGKVYSVEAFSDGEDVKLDITAPEQSEVNVEKLATNSTGTTDHTIDDQLNKHINFTLKATNNGSINATNVIVTDKIPSSSFKFISSNDTRYNSSTGQWNIGDLNSGESVFLSIEVQIIDTGSLINVANISSDNSPPSPGDSVTVNVGGNPNTPKSNNPFDGVNLRNTALPIILLILILMISFVVYRRKN